MKRREKAREQERRQVFKFLLFCFFLSSSYFLVFFMVVIFQLYHRQVVAELANRVTGLEYQVSGCVFVWVGVGGPLGSGCGGWVPHCGWVG